MGIAFLVYRTATSLAAPFWLGYLRRRALRGKEDSDRLQERLGQASCARPPGVLVWVHALGIGEASAMISLINALRHQRPHVSFLLTTNTRTGADGLQSAGLPTWVIHQYAPVDTGGAVTAFLDHWRPDVFVLAELDLWPRMLHALSALSIPMIMVNARLSDRRFRNRMRLRALFGPLLLLFRSILVQDQTSAARMSVLGACKDKVCVGGLLKAAANPLPADEPMLDLLRHAVGRRPVWLAAATEEREQEAVLRAHVLACKTIPDLLLILAPRQLTDAESAFRACEAAFGATPQRRSLGDVPAPDQAVYLADSIGEMGLWYRLAPISFIGHSMNVKGDPILSGKNPFEATLLDSVVIHGPCIHDFSESYSELDECGAAVLINNYAELAAEVIYLCSDGTERIRRNSAAQRVTASERAALPITLDAVLAAM